MLRAEYGEAVIVSALIKLIGETVRFFAVGKSMNDLQLVETAKIIVGQYYFLKLEDFKLFFVKFKRGEYGALFDRIDGQVIMLALSKYCEERIGEAERLSLQKHKETLAKENEQFYLVKVGSNWLRSVGDNFEEIESKEMATQYTFGVALKLKQWLTKEYFTNPNHVLICDIRKPNESFFDYLEKNKPALLPKGEKYKRATNEYFEMKTRILEDDKMTYLEKQNAIRRLAGLHELTAEEFKKQEIHYSLKNKP